MPHLVVRGILQEKLLPISKSLIDELADICECGSDNFTIELPLSTYIFEEKVVDAFPFIEVKWFDRGKAVRDAVARSITTHIQSTGVEEVEVAFIAYKEDAYYINGVSCE